MMNNVVSLVYKRPVKTNFCELVHRVLEIIDGGGEANVVCIDFSKALLLPNIP